MGNILITGALGNVGAYAVEYTLKNGQSVTAAGRRAESITKRYGNAVRAVSFDFTAPETFEDALRDADRVFLMRPPHLGKPEDLQPFVEALKSKRDLKLVAFLSLFGVEKNPFPPHHKIEKMIAEAGIPYCFIRPSFFMQNLSSVHAFEIKHFDQIVVPVGKALTSFIDAEDIGELAARVLSEPEMHRNSKYEITGPEALDYCQVAEILSRNLGRSIRYTAPNPGLTKRYWIEIRGLEKEYVTVMGMLYLMTRMGTAKETTDVFRQVMGKEPRSFESFVQKNLASWQ